MDLSMWGLAEMARDTDGGSLQSLSKEKRTRGTLWEIWGMVLAVRLVTGLVKNGLSMTACGKMINSQAMEFYTSAESILRGNLLQTLCTAFASIKSAKSPAIFIVLKAHGMEGYHLVLPLHQVVLWEHLICQAAQMTSGKIETPKLMTRSIKLMIEKKRPKSESRIKERDQRKVLRGLKEQD